MFKGEEILKAIEELSKKTDFYVEHFNNYSLITIGLGIIIITQNAIIGYRNYKGRKEIKKLIENVRKDL